MTRAELDNQIESLIDKHGLQMVLDSLATVCGEKAEHLAVTWQDTASAKAWANAAQQLDELTLETSL